jgi:tetratricopeptide (TPR) repeat protein
MVSFAVNGWAQAQQAVPAEEATAEPAAEAAGPPAVAPAPSPAEGARPSADTVPERVRRIGGVEAILLENDDAESGLEAGQELLREAGEDGLLRLLLGSCLMRLGRPADALEHFQRAADQAGGDPATQMHALYNLGRALALAGRLEDAAAAYDRYATFAREHMELNGFPEEATRMAQVLRSRTAAAAPRRTRRRSSED